MCILRTSAMSEYRAFTEEQEQLLKNWGTFNPLAVQRDVSNAISIAASIEELDDLRLSLSNLCNRVIDALGTLPSINTLEQYFSTSENFTHGAVARETEIDHLKMPGDSHISILEGILKNLELFLNFVDKLNEKISDRHGELEFGPSAGSPERELGLLLGVLNIEQLRSARSAFVSLVGEIDFKPFRKVDASGVVDKMRQILNLKIDRTVKVTIHYIDGSFEWYGVGNGKAARPRDQARHMLDSKTNFSTTVLNWIRQMDQLQIEKSR